MGVSAVAFVGLVWPYVLLSAACTMVGGLVLVVILERRRPRVRVTWVPTEHQTIHGPGEFPRECEVCYEEALAMHLVDPMPDTCHCDTTPCRMGCSDQ